MQGSTFSGWQMIVFAAIAVVLLVAGTFRLDEVLARKKKRKTGPQLVPGRRFQQPGARIVDPHGQGSARPPMSVRSGSGRRPRVIP